MIETELVLEEVLKERQRQDKKWGEQNHLPTYWLSILGEEFGEVSKAVCELLLGDRARAADCLRNYREELIHTAAVAIAAVQSFDRNEGKL